VDRESLARRQRRIGLLVASAAALCSAPAGAIVADPPPRICNEYAHSDHVFSGRVLSETQHWHEYLRGDPTTVYEIRVDHVFKGKVPRVARLYTANNSGRGVLDTGQRAIVFAERQEGRMAFSGSSNSESGAGVPKVIAEIRAYLANPPSVATISGRIDRSGKTPVGGARLLVASGSTSRFVRANRNGTFQVAVTPGQWSVRIAEPGWASARGLYSYDSADKMVLRKGDCADLEIEAAAPHDKVYGPGWKRWPRSAR